MAPPAPGVTLPCSQHIPTLREDVVYYADPTAQEYSPDKAPINLRVWA